MSSIENHIENTKKQQPTKDNPSSLHGEIP